MYQIIIFNYFLSWIFYNFFSVSHFIIHNIFMNLWMTWQLLEITHVVLLFA